MEKSKEYILMMNRVIKNAIAFFILLIVWNTEFLMKIPETDRMLFASITVFSLAQFIISAVLVQILFMAAKPLKIVLHPYIISMISVQKREKITESIDKIIYFGIYICILIISYIIFIPSLKQFLGLMNISSHTMLLLINIGIVATGLGLVFKLWKAIQSLIDILTLGAEVEAPENIIIEGGLKCDICGEINETDAKFCGKCGNLMKKEEVSDKCKYCGEIHNKDARFCPKTGKTLR